ncbi:MULTISPECIES: hypothetical protein [unclassified Bartonella]|uniref:hypothetical protein n=1 Tax=unclassified Bartonella TaxID=2645622 RepID=UPI0038575261
MCCLEKYQAVEYNAQASRQVVPRDKNISVMGPAEAPLAPFKGVIVFNFYCFFVFLGGQRCFDIQGFIGVMLANAPKMPSSIRIVICITGIFLNTMRHSGRNLL